MKRLLAMILTVTVIFTLTACGSSVSNDSAKAPANEIKEETDNAQDNAQDNVTASDETTSAEASEAAENSEAAEASEEAAAETEEEAPKRATQTYTITASDDTAEVTFDFIKDDNITVKEEWGTKNRTLIEDESNLSSVEVLLIHDRVAGPNITKEEEDFYDENYHDYAKVEKGGFSGWEVYEGDFGYQIELIISDADDEGNGYALKIQVMKALAGMKDDMHFEIDEFVPSADFQDLFDTIKLNVK